jgi:hypothetical protein
VKKLNIDIKTLIIIILSVVVLVLAFGISILIMNKVNNKNIDHETTTTDTNKYEYLYSKVTRLEAGKLYFNDDNGEEVAVDTNNRNVEVGDTIRYKINDKGEKYAFTLIKEVEGKTHHYQVYEYSMTNTTTAKKENGTTASTAAKATEEEVLSFIKDSNNEYSSLNNTEENKNKAKDYFVTLIDFIFYDRPIKGRTFKELSASAQAKTIYYTLKIDSIIDNNIPGYKDTLSDSYKIAKNQLIASYTELSIKTCTSNEELCNDLKKDTEDLKTSLNITWDIIKDIFNEIIKPAGKDGIKKLSEWYEVWKNA